jgi:iron(II)-dependent oxidoreductase
VSQANRVVVVDGLVTAWWVNRFDLSGSPMNKTMKIAGTAGLTGALVATAILGVSLTGKWLIAAAAIPPAILLAYLGFRQPKPKTSEEKSEEPAPAPKKRQLSPKPTPVEPSSYDVNDPAYLAQRMLEQGRYSLLLRPQIAANLREEHLKLALRCLDEAMGIVPEGDVLLQSWRTIGETEDPNVPRDRLVHVEAIYLDRYPVTNEQYQRFVDDGGYENISLWDTSIWPAVLDFVDRTGHSGPRGWQEGHFPEGLEDHPVVGVSWYEAAAYSRWVGKRLPSDPEWVKAGCWPVLTQGTRPMQRRYPWGDTMDRELANLWSSGIKGTMSVYELPGGVSVGGVYHLIGNVWEWTTSNFGVWDTTSRKLETATPMKSIRGGAYNTYFDTQAMCQFQSGESPINRKHNIGFRCALAMCDVVSSGFEDEETTHEDLVACGAEAEEEVQ